MIKTNAMRILDKSNAEYKTYSYDSSKAISGIEVAQSLNQNINVSLDVNADAGAVSQFGGNIGASYRW